MRINKHDTNGTKPLLAVGELGYDNYPSGGDIGRVYVGTGSSNIAQAKKSEVVTVDGKIDTHVARIDNPHTVTKAQVGLGNVDNTSDSSKNVLSATKLTTARTINGVAFDGSANIMVADNTKVALTGDQTVAGIKTFSSNPISTSTQSTAIDALTRKDYVDTKVDKVTSTDNAIVRFDGTGGAVQNSSILIDDNGNLNITGKRITGDFSNSTVANRLAFQTSTLNGNTSISLCPNGTSQVSAINMYSTSDPMNSSSAHIGIVGGESLRIHSIVNGTGTHLPISFAAGGNERMRIDTSGNVLVTSGTGGLGYGTGSGGTVTQLTSKSTAVTLNKPTGRITTSNSALSSGASIAFTVNNTLFSDKDILALSGYSFGYNYRIEVNSIANGYFAIRISNISASSLSEAIDINFALIKGAIA